MSCSAFSVSEGGLYDVHVFADTWFGCTLIVQHYLNLWAKSYPRRPHVIGW